MFQDGTPAPQEVLEQQDRDNELLQLQTSPSFKNDPLKELNRFFLGKGISNSQRMQAMGDMKGLDAPVSIKDTEDKLDLDKLSVFGVGKIQDQVRKEMFPTAQSAIDWKYREKKGTTDPKNETDLLAEGVIADYDSVKNALAQTNGDFKKAAILYYGMKDPQTAAILKEGKELPIETQERLLNHFLNDPLVYEATESGQFMGMGLRQKYFSEKDHFRENNPHQWTNNLIAQIAQGREDYGENNPFLNLTGVKSSDRVMQKLYEDGKIDKKDLDFYDEYVRGFIASGKKKIPTTGLVENAWQSLSKVAKDVPIGAFELTGLNTLTSTAGERAFENLQEQENQVGVKAKGLVRQLTQATGNLAGVVLPIGAQAKILQATKLIKNANVANQMAMGLTFYHDLYSEAEKKDPEAGLLNQLQATLQSAVYAKLNPVLGRLSSTMVKAATPEIRTILKNLETEAITGAQATQQATKVFLDKAKKVAGHSLSASNQMALAGLINDGISGVFTGKYDFDESIQNAAETWKHLMLGTPLLNIAALGKNVRQTVGKTLYEMTENPVEGRATLEKLMKEDAELPKELLTNYDHAVKVREQLNEMELPQNKKEEYLVTEVKRKLLEDKIKNSPSKNLNTQTEKDLEALDIEQKSIVDPDFGMQKEVEEFYNSELLPKGLMEMVEVEGKFSPAKAGGLVKFIAQQANNLNAEWKPNDTKVKFTKPNVPDALIELANERWKKELEKAGITEKEGISEPIELSEKTPEDYILPEQMEQPTEVNIPKIKSDEKPVVEERVEVVEPVEAIEKSQLETIAPEEIKGTGDTKIPPAETGRTTEGEGDVAGITHAANEVRRKDRALPEYEKEPQTFEAWNNEAEKQIKEGYDVEKLMDKIEAGHDPTPVENSIRKIYIATLDAEIAKNPTDALLAKQKRFIEIGDLANSRAGRNLVSLKGENSPLESISDFYVAKMEAAGVDKLTEAQKKETKEAFDNVQKADENATAAMESYREEIAKLKAENELLKQKKTASKKEKGDWAQQRKDAVEGAREALKKLRSGESGLSAVPLPGVRELIAIAPHVKKYVGSLLGEGVQTLKEVVTKAYEEFKDLLPGITEKDIHNIIAGEHNKERPTRSDLAAKMRDLKDEAYYANKLERLLSGTEPKKEKDKVKRNAQITELREKIAQFKKAERDANKPIVEEVPDEVKKLQAIVKRNEKEAAELQERIKKGDFETKKKVPFLEDPEMQRKFPKEYKAALDAIVKREEARHEFDIAIMKDQMARRNFAKKSIDVVGDVLGTTRALVTGIDASGIGIQNLVAMVAHPRSAAKALPASFGDFVSAKNQERWLASVHNSKLYPLAQKAGLDITEPQSLKSSQKEEVFTHNLLDKRIRFKGKDYIISKYTTKPFERIFTGLGNRMRWNLWARGVEKLTEEGYTWEKHPEQFQSLATILNTETGRGKLHPQIDKAYNLISAGIWSPRLMASRLNIIGLGDLGNMIMGGKKGYYGGLTPKMREYAIKDFSKFAVFVGGLTALAGMTFADDTDFDPRRPTFGSFEADGKRYNLFGGFTQYVRLPVKMIRSGEGVGNEFKKSGQLKTGLRFLWSKSTPIVSMAAGWGNKDRWGTPRDYMGQPMTASGSLESVLVPLSIRGIAQGIKKEGAGSLIWTGIPSFVGFNVSYQSDFDKKEETEHRPSRSSSDRPERPTRER